MIERTTEAIGRMRSKDIIDWIRDYFLKPENNGAKAVIGISGGKDSTVCAALLVKAIGAENVFGVLMPNGEQYDLDIAKDIAKTLGIKYSVINIKDAYEATANLVRDEFVTAGSMEERNIAPRLRMTILYAVAASMNGRVVNTSNRSETYLGYCTKWGDDVGDFSLLLAHTASDVVKIGEELGLPDEWIHKVPEDGFDGVSDEERFGFTYQELDDYLVNYTCPKDFSHLQKIRARKDKNEHKRDCVNIPYPPLDRYPF